MNEKTTIKTADSETNSHPSGTNRGVVLRSIAWFAVGIVLTANMWLLATQFRRLSENSQEHAFWAVCHPGTTTEARADYFLKLAADGNTEWRSANLSGLSLQAVDLSGVDLTQASLTSGNFESADFSEATLGGAALDLCELAKAKFSKAKLRKATFFKSRLLEADFRNADMLSASFEQCVAHNANFVAAGLGDAFLAMADFTGADFTGADLSGANLEAAILKNADLALTSLHATTLTDTDFTDANWWRARGLSSLQMDDLTLMFPPSPNAPESRQRDFEIWLNGRIDERQRPDAD